MFHIKEREFISTVNILKDILVLQLSIQYSNSKQQILTLELHLN